MKKEDILFLVSFVMVGVTTVVWQGIQFFDTGASEELINGLGILDLVFLALLTYTAAKKAPKDGKKK